MSKKERVQYSFATVSACPRCRGTQTRATSTQGRIQYRKCQAPVCRHTYHVTGTLVPHRKEKDHGQDTERNSTNIDIGSRARALESASGE